MITTFGDTFQDFIYFRTYSRWVEEKGRREFWEESVDRYEAFFSQKVPKAKQNEFSKACEAIKNIEVMGSMRALWTAGKALEREHLCLYNCAYTTIDTVRSFSELLYLLMCGTGSGYSVERQYVIKLPDIPELVQSEDVIVFADSKLGWAEGYHKFLKKLYSGNIPKYDLSKIRAKGMPLKTFGGRASGGQVLENLLKFTINMFKNSQGRKLNSCDCNDLCCFIASVVIVGGVRRSSCISLSNPSDDRMRHAKDGQFWNTHPYRTLANNSIAYTEKPSSDVFLSEFLSLIRSGSGERGIFNRESCEFIIQQNEYRKSGYEWGGNPCMERILRPKELCNLSEVIVRPEDDKDILCRKVRQATILGCVQAAYTDFNFISRDWKKNAEEERLIGVSLTGLRDHYVLNKVTKEAKLWLTEMRQVCIDTAKEWSASLEINMPACQTCVKPSGCRTKDGLLTTDDGIFLLDELSYDHDNKWLPVDSMEGSYGKVTKTYYNGLADVLEIKCSFGLTLRCTPNHEWLVHKKGWVSADSLSINDRLTFSFEEFKCKDQLLKSPDLSALYCNCNFDVRFPEKMNEDLAWLLGYIWGDGAMCPDKSRFRFVDGNKKVIAKAKRVFMSLFNLEGNVRKLDDRNAYSLEISSRAVWAFFEENDMVKDLSRIPLILRKSSKESLVAFLSGIVDADGCIRNNQFILSTAKKDFAEHIQQVYLTLGLVFSISENSQRENSFSKKSMYMLSLAWGQCNETKFLLPNNCIKLEGHAIPKSGSRGSVYKLGRILSIESIGKQETFDVETETHWYWSGAVMSHNSVSALVGTASGLHARFAQHYIRRVRVSAIDPLAQLLIDAGVPHTPENGQTEADVDTWVFEFPMKSPKNSVMQDELSAIDQLEYWLMLQKYWCSGKPSCTIHVADEEWVEVAAWVYKHWDYMSGVAFLPKSNSVYEKMPFEEISELEYNERIAAFPAVDFTKLSEYEISDRTNGATELACSSGSCEIV